MIVLRDIESVGQLAQAEIRQLIQQRIEEITQGEAYDPDVYGQFVLVEAGDCAAEIEAVVGCKIVSAGDADFAPSFEWLVEHSTCYEAVFIFSDDGYGIDLLIPKLPDVDADLLAMCRKYAVPAGPESVHGDRHE